MKNLLAFGLLWVLVLGATAQAQEAPPPGEAAPPVNEKLAKFYKNFEKHDAYEEVAFKALKAGKDDYKNKKIYYEGVFLGFADELPDYFEKSGFKSSKYYVFALEDISLPILLKKNDDSQLLFGELANGATLRVYGELKKFRFQAKAGRMPEYYFEPVYVKIIKAEPGRDAPKDRPLFPRKLWGEGDAGKGGR